MLLLLIDAQAFSSSWICFNYVLSGKFQLWPTSTLSESLNIHAHASPSRSLDFWYLFVLQVLLVGSFSWFEHGSSVIIFQDSIFLIDFWNLALLGLTVYWSWVRFLEFTGFDLSSARDIYLFDERCWCSWWSVASLSSWGYGKVALLAF